MDVFSIGVYNTSEQIFFDKLIDNEIQLFIDIRKRRGVRGSKYSFVNSTKLQQKLKAYGIAYMYVQELAPTDQIREVQKKADLKNKQLKSQRTVLSNEFIAEYKKQVLNVYNVELMIKKIQNNNINKIVLFCVEENANACHRSIITDELSSVFKFQVKHL